MIPDGADAHYEVAGHRYLLTHGDNLGVKGGDGIISLFGPIIRGDFKMRNASTAINRPYDTLLLGHWHTYIPLRRVIVNGSLKGFDEFAHVALRAVPEPAIQALWFTHPRFGITSQWPIFCDHNAKRRPAQLCRGGKRHEQVPRSGFVGARHFYGRRSGAVGSRSR